MTALNRVRVGLTGFAGGPGVATFYFTGLQTGRQSLQTLWGVLATYMPDDVTIQVEATGDIIESTNGQLIGTWVKDPLAPIQGTSLSGYAAPVGAMVRWVTEGIVAGKRVRGRTFIVPLYGGAFDSVGRVGAGSAAALQVATQSFVFEQSLDFVIWSRPFDGAPAVAPSPQDPMGRPARAARLGSHALVKSSVVPQKAVVLRSRRD